MKGADFDTVNILHKTQMILSPELYNKCTYRHNLFLRESKGINKIYTNGCLYLEYLKKRLQMRLQ